VNFNMIQTITLSFLQYQSLQASTQLHEEQQQ